MKLGIVQLGVSENSVALNPMVLLIIIPIKWLFHWEYTLFSDKPNWFLLKVFRDLFTLTVSSQGYLVFLHA